MVLANDNENFNWRTTPPLETTLWAYASHKNGYSLPLVKPSGFCTFVHIKIGRQLWFVGRRDVRNILTSLDDPLHWECADLKPGDHLIMAPGTPHFFITLEDCLAVGAYFYNTNTSFLIRTMESLVSERFFGPSLTEEEYPTSLIILFKVADDFLFRVKALEGGRGE